MSIFSLDGVQPVVPENDDYWIAPNAQVIGKITLEEASSIWFGAVLRGDNERITVGKGSNVQDGCLLHTDMGFPLHIGENCTIGHNAIIHGCTIGNNSLIGMGATVLNGAVIGENCIVGAGALIGEGKVIPDGSLVVGLPGKVIRKLDEAAILSLRKSANLYQENMRRFRDGLKPVD